MRNALLSSAALACVVATAPFGVANAAGPAAPNSDLPCASPFYVTSDGEPNAVVVSVIDLPGPFTGAITAYGADRMWTGTIERAAMVRLRFGATEASVRVRADGPIEGIAYTPAFAQCTFRAARRPRYDYEVRDVQRPVLTLGNPQPAEPAGCAQPYMPPTVKHAFEPQAPGGGNGGTVRVAVALDERGAVRLARVVDSPSAALNPTAVDAAKRSEYTPAIFRCKPVPGSYQFAIEYPG